MSSIFSTNTLSFRFALPSLHLKHIRNNDLFQQPQHVSTHTLDTLCDILDCKIEDIVTHIKQKR